MSRPDIVSVGDDFRKWPERLWGSRDRERAAKVEQATAGVRMPEPLVPLVGPTPVPGHVGLNPSTDEAESRREDDRRRAADRVLEDAGVRPRPW
jgi:hypothetical protein